MTLGLGRWVTAALLAALLMGCGIGRQVSKGADRYRHADYAGAMEKWRYVEDREDEMNDKGRVRYLVHRGLTHHRLYTLYRQPEEYALAQYFLGRGKQAYDAGDAGWLDSRTVAEMKDALEELDPARATPTSGVVILQLPPGRSPAPTGEDGWDDDD
jgi:hypothetical protein